MRRIRLMRAIQMLGLLAVVALVPAFSRADDDAKTKRIAYIVKHGSAKDLAKVLGTHLKGVAEVDALPEPNSNVLLLRVDAKAFDEVVKTLELLDRRPRTVVVDVWVADVPVRKADKDKPKETEEAIDEKELTGPVDAVQAKLKALQRQGKLGTLKQVQLTVPENQQGSYTLGQTVPVVMGSHVTGTGIVTRNIMYRNVGTVLRLTPHVGDKAVTLELVAEDMRLHFPEDGPAVGMDENKAPIRAAEMVLGKFEGKISVPAGQAVVAQGVKVTSKSPAQTLVVVSARVVE
jgi:type II secretory pathway component GspD/PulD (secretin)